MISIDKAAEDLFDKIRSRFQDVVIGDEKAKETVDPSKARFFSFTYSTPIENGKVKKFGRITISVVDGQTLKIFYDMKIDKNMNENEKKQWYRFLRGLGKFSKRHKFDSFDVRDITTSNLELRDLAHLNKDAEVFDSGQVLSETKLSGTSKSSYQVLENVKIIVRHSKKISEEESPYVRSRNIQSIFIETESGERFKLPEKTTINEARIVARHVRNEGTIHDQFGQHLISMLTEMHQLKNFSRNMRGRVFEDPETQSMLESAQEHYGVIKSDFFSMRTQKGYESFRENWQPSQNMLTDEIDIDTIRSRFEKRVFDKRLDGALPIVVRAYNERKNKMEEEFGAWMESVIDSTYKKMIQEDIDPVAPVDSSSPLSTVGSNRMDIESMSSTRTDIDNSGDNHEMHRFFQKHDINVQFNDGKYVFTSEEERSRALDWASKENINLDEKNTEVQKYDPQPFGASMNDQTIRNDVAMESLKKLAGI